MNTDQKASIVDVSISVLKLVLNNSCAKFGLVVLTFRTVSIYMSPLHLTTW